MKEETRKHKEANAVGGMNHETQGEIMPNWKDELARENPHDGNVTFDWAFVQGSQIEENLVIDKNSKET